MKRFLAALVILAASSFPALAQTGSQKTTAALNSEINALFPDNVVGAITPFDARQTLLDLVASSGNTASTNTWALTQTFSTGIVTPQLPHLTTSVEGTGFPGMDGVTGGVNWFLWNAPPLGQANDSAPTFRADRKPSTGNGGLLPTGTTVPGFVFNTSIPAGDKYSEWGIASTLDDFSAVAGRTAVSIAGYANKRGGDNVAVWGINAYCADFTGVSNPTTACVNEFDAGACAICNGGTDVNKQRVVIQVVATGAAGTHVSSGILMGPSDGVIIDRGITLSNGGFTGSWGVGFDTAAVTVATASVFIAPTQQIVLDGSWTGTNATVATYSKSLSVITGTLSYQTSTSGSGASSLFQITAAGQMNLAGPFTTAGTSNPTMVAGQVFVYGSQAIAPTMSANGEGAIYLGGTSGTTRGLTLQGKGSTNDITLQNSAGTAVCQIATGGTAFSCTTLTLTNPLAVGQGGTGLGSGTSGGIPYFASTSTMASSALLAANCLVYGGGAGVAPATSSNCPQVTSTGEVTFNRYVYALVNTGAPVWPSCGGSGGFALGWNFSNSGQENDLWNCSTGASTSAAFSFWQQTGASAGTKMLQFGTAQLSYQASGTSAAILLGPAAGATTYGAISMNGTLTPANMSGFFSGGGGDNSFYFTAPVGFGIQFQTANASYATFNSGGITSGVSILISAATAGVGYTTGAGGAVTQATSRTTGVTLNKINGDITLFSAAATSCSGGTASALSFVVSNTTIGAKDIVALSQLSGTDKYLLQVTNIVAGTSFTITYCTFTGTTTEQPVFHFDIIRGVNAFLLKRDLGPAFNDNTPAFLMENVA